MIGNVHLSVLTTNPDSLKVQEMAEKYRFKLTSAMIDIVDSLFFNKIKYLLFLQNYTRIQFGLLYV